MWRNEYRLIVVNELKRRICVGMKDFVTWRFGMPGEAEIYVPKRIYVLRTFSSNTKAPTTHKHWLDRRERANIKV